MSQSHELRLILADNQALSTNAIAIAAQGCDLIGDQDWGRDEGKRGTRQRYACGDRLLREVVSGGFEFNPTAAELDWFLQRFIGDAIATFPGAACTPGETVPQFYAIVDKGPENFRYDKVVVNRFSLSVREGGYLVARVDLIGSQETSGVSWPASPPTPSCATEFVCADTTFNLGGSAWPFKSLDMTFDNYIAQSQHENALYRTIFESEDFMVGLQATFGYRSDTKALYRRSIAGDSGSVVFNNGSGGHTYTFTFGNVKAPGRGPTVPGQGEITKTLNMEARATKSPAAPVVSITKVANP